VTAAPGSTVTASTSLGSSSSTLSASATSSESDHEVRIPCLADSAEGGAEDDVYHELRVFALRQIQSRFAGNYKNLLICRYHHHHSPPDLSSNHSRSRRRPHSHQHGPIPSLAHSLTPRKESLVLPQHLPELRSWLSQKPPPSSEKLSDDYISKHNSTSLLPHDRRQSETFEESLPLTTNSSSMSSQKISAASSQSKFIQTAESLLRATISAIDSPQLNVPTA